MVNVFRSYICIFLHKSIHYRVKNFRKCIEFLVAQQPRGPPVTKAGLAPFGPWAVFLTWNRPTGADPDDIWAYRIKFNSFVIHIADNGPIMFHPQGRGITPDRPVTVEIVALYNYRMESAPMILGMNALRASNS